MASCLVCGVGIRRSGGLCPECRARLDQADAVRRNPLGSWPRHDVPLDHVVGQVLGAELKLTRVEAFQNGFKLRYQAHGYPVRLAGTEAVNPNPRINGLWDAEDDLGRSYRGVGQAVVTTAAGCRGDIHFFPEMSPAARELRISASSAGETLFETRVTLGTRRPWPPLAPNSEASTPVAAGRRSPGAQLEDLVEALGGPGAHPPDASARLALELADRFHREGLERLVELILVWRGDIFLDAVMRDEHAGLLLAAYGLGPRD